VVLPMWSFLLALGIMAVGLLGVVLPAVPGVALIWATVVVYAIVERFATIDPLSFIFLSVLGLVGSTADLWMAQLGAQVGGASVTATLWSLGGSLLGGLIGLAFGGVGALPGMILGSIAGVLISQYRERHEWRAALKATLGLLVGWTVSGLVQLATGLAMMGIFAWQVLRG